MLYPLTFQPIFKERVWGGRKLEERYGKPLPPTVPIGESWEVSDRPSDASVIANGPLAGKDLHWLVQNRGVELLGQAEPHNGRFPLLVKILDAEQKLSLQVHPPAQSATQLSGEPKTEMWYIAQAVPGAELFVGLRKGVTRAGFEAALKSGTVADCFHRLGVRAGDAMFLPSGRVHAIGAGLLIFEIQQNSDTTYRVFDWGRVGLDGQPRALHVHESLASIDFQDFEPSLVSSAFRPSGALQVRQLASDPLFMVEVCRTTTRTDVRLEPRRMQILGLLKGKLTVLHGEMSVVLAPGQFCVVPASLDGVEARLEGAEFLRIEAGGTA